MTYLVDPRVATSIGALPAWQQAVCREVRGLVHAPAFTAMFKKIIADNRTGCRRKSGR